MEKAEKLKKNINQIMNGEIKLDELADSFYEYIKQLKENSDNSKKKGQTWPGWFASPFIRPIDHVYKSCTNTHSVLYTLLSKLEKDKTYIPEDNEILDENVRQYQSARKKLKVLKIPNFTSFITQQNAWNEIHIRTGPYKKFVNGLINYALSANKAKAYYDINGKDGVILAIGEYVDAECAEQCLNLLREYVPENAKDLLTNILSRNARELPTLCEILPQLLAESKRTNENLENKKQTEDKIQGTLAIIIDKHVNGKFGKEITSLFEGLTRSNETTPAIVMEKLETIKSVCDKLMNRQ